jgi:hypothetical protein
MLTNTLDYDFEDLVSCVEFFADTIVIYTRLSLHRENINKLNVFILRYGRLTVTLVMLMSSVNTHHIPGSG